MRVTFEDIDPLAALPDVLTLVHPDHRGRYAAVLAPAWQPDQATEFNGAVWPCLGSTVWALRTTTSFEDAIRAAIDLGGDTDPVAAVTGGLAGGYYGLDAIPARWTQPLHVPLPGFDGRVLHLADLLHLCTPPRRLNRVLLRTLHELRPQPQSPDQRIRKEDNSICFDIESEHRMTMGTLRMHQHRLTQPPPDLPQEAAEQFKSLLPLQLAQINVEIDFLVCVEAEDRQHISSQPDTQARALSFRWSR
jgi:hypothetical protein